MTRALAAFAFLVLVFGTTFGAIKIGIVDGWPPLFSAGVRFATAGLLVLVVAAAAGQTKRLTPAELRGAVSVGLSVITITFGALYSAEMVLPSGLAALLSATGPLFAVALAIVSGARRFDGSIAVGLILATGGVVLVSGVGALHGRLALLASLAIVVSEFAFAWGLSRAKSLRTTIPALQLAGVQQSLGGAALLILSIAFEHRLPARVDGVGIAAIVYLIVIGSAVGHTVAIWLAGATSATFASSWTYLSPFIALLFGAVSLHELPGAGAWLGGLLVIAGAIVLNRDLGTTLTAVRSQYRAQAGRPDRARV